MPEATTEPPQGRISSVGAIGRDQTRLEVGADDDWEERWVRWQRISWAAMAVVLLLGIVGFLDAALSTMQLRSLRKACSGPVTSR
jgi:hypothetical protein